MRRSWMRWLVGLACLALAACDVTPTGAPSSPSTSSVSNSARWSPEEAARAFREVVTTVEPVAERECRRRTNDVNCDFRIIVDRDPRAPANAYQSLADNGRPEITFTIGLIAEVRNADELAFVLAHEASHHIEGHLQRQSENAAAGAVIFQGLATLTGASASDVEAASDLGAFVGARSYSKEFELEADSLGTVIAYRAGYNPLRGAEFFNRIPDPGNRFLGSHPPNAERIEIVRRTYDRIAS